MPAGGSLNCRKVQGVGGDGEAWGREALPVRRWMGRQEGAVDCGADAAAICTARNTLPSDCSHHSNPWNPPHPPIHPTHRNLLCMLHQPLVRAAEGAPQRRLLRRHQRQRRRRGAQHLGRQQVIPVPAARGRRWDAEAQVGDAGSVWPPWQPHTRAGRAQAPPYPQKPPHTPRPAAHSANWRL